ncbi:MAG: DUF1385 domain-containing protein, partial [Chthonomonadales bacterium]
SPADSLYRSIELLRYSGTDMLPVVNDFGHVAGVFNMHCLRPFLARDLDDVDLSEPVEKWMRQPESLGRTEMDVDEILSAIAAGGETNLIIVDNTGRYYGMVTLADLLSPHPTPIRPHPIGGMATPWGVYLTNGSLQAGASNLKLVGGGVAMGLVFALSSAGVGALCMAIQNWMHIPVFDILREKQPSTIAFDNLDWYLIHTIPVVALLVIMRSLPLAGYHAAEHQSVHAMERGEPLLVDVVRRMPRVHPRCGTNLMAGGMIFGLVSQFLPALHIGFGQADSTLVAGLVTIFTWRNFGAFLQQYFTTRPATDKQIQSAIKAAEELQAKFLQTPPARPTLIRRIWCMGMPQMLLGISLTLFLVFSLLDKVVDWI